MAVLFSLQLETNFGFSPLLLFRTEIAPVRSSFWSELLVRDLNKMLLLLVPPPPLLPIFDIYPSALLAAFLDHFGFVADEYVM